MKREPLTSVAHHEAGHAVAIAFSGAYRVEAISLKPVKGTSDQYDSSGHVRISPVPSVSDFYGSACRREAEEILLIFLAGPAAERVHLGKPRMESGFVQEIAFHHLNQLVTSHAAGCYREYLRWHQARAAAFVEFHWETLLRLASQLLKRTELSGDEVGRIINIADH